MTTVFFVRHGLTRENREGRINGQRPGELLVTETERYIAAVVPLLSVERLTWILSSDLARARETRDIVYKFLKQPYIQRATSPLLRERAMGFYEGLRWNEVPPLVQEQRHKAGYNFRIFGGESESDVRERVQYAIKEFATHYLNQRIVCIAHAGWLRELIVLANQVDAIPDQWTDRTAIYRANLSSQGSITLLQPIPIAAHVHFAEE